MQILQSELPEEGLSFLPWVRPCWGQLAASSRIPHSALCLQPRRSLPSETSPHPSPMPPPSLWGEQGNKVISQQRTTKVRKKHIPQSIGMCGNYYSCVPGLVKSSCFLGWLFVFEESSHINDHYVKWR